MHTPVTVTASITSPALSTQSTSLTVSTGIPASDTFTVAIGPATYSSQGVSTVPACPNVEAWDLEGVTVPITVSLADRYNNPVLNNTSVSFYTDGGKITPSCQTAGGTGTCEGTGDTVTWTSENPQPTPTTAFPSKSAEPGRVVLIATAIGEESFTDNSGSGFYQSGDAFVNLGDPYDNSQELPIPQSPYTNSAYVLGDYFLPAQTGEPYAPPPTPPVFVGITCTGTSPTSTCTDNTLAIGQSALIIMSTGGAAVVPASATGAFAISSGQIVPNPNTSTGGGGSTGTITFTISSSYADYTPPSGGSIDVNPISAGSTIAVTAASTVGTLSTTSTSFTEGCSSNAAGDQYTISLTAVPSSPTGDITIQVTSAGTKTLTTDNFPVN